VGDVNAGCIGTKRHPGGGGGGGGGGIGVLTFSVAVFVSTLPHAFPVMVSGYCPSGVEGKVEIVSIVAPQTLPGEVDRDAPLGRPETDTGIPVEKKQPSNARGVAV